jgi:ferredoxin--NADP+ reductase
MSDLLSPSPAANDPGHLHVAVVGSGPAGYYTVEGLLDRLGSHVSIDVIDRLPTPYGLIRAGVAPDHQSIKNVVRRYEATHSTGDVSFVGHLMVGRDVSIAELMQMYDAVVLATGAPSDRPLGIPGDDLPGVQGSARFVGWYNSHPDFAEHDPLLDTPGVAVIGNGNVALDVARVLAKTSAEMAASDLASHAARHIHAARLTDISIIGRRGPYQASFTTKELGEFGELHEAVPVVDPADLPDAAGDAALEPGLRKVVGHLRSFAGRDPGSKPRRIWLRFLWRPVQVLGTTRVTGLRLERNRLEGDKAVGTGEMMDLPCGLVVSAIGYRTEPIPGVPFDAAGGRFANQEGQIDPRLYCVGWAKRGPSGTIGTNRPDGFAVAERIAREVVAGNRAGRSGLYALIRQRGLTTVDFAGWKRIEAAEIAAASGPSPRAKFAQVDPMLSVARSAQ